MDSGTRAMTMTAKDVEMRTTVLETKVATIEKSISSIGDSLNNLVVCVAKMESDLKVFKWILTLAVTVGPTIGVFLVELMGK